MNGWMDGKEIMNGVGVFCVCLQAFLQTHSRAIEIASWSNLKSMTPSLWWLLSHCHLHWSFLFFSCRLKSLFYRSSNLQYFKRLIQIPQLPEVRTHNQVKKKGLSPVLHWLVNCSFNLFSTCIFCILNSKSFTYCISDLNCAFCRILLTFCALQLCRSTSVLWSFFLQNRRPQSRSTRLRLTTWWTQTSPRFR